MGRGRQGVLQEAARKEKKVRDKENDSEQTEETAQGDGEQQKECQSPKVNLSLV